MKAKRLWSMALIAILMGTGGLRGDTIVLTIERTTMPTEDWDLLKSFFGQYGAGFWGYFGTGGFSKDLEGDEMRFTFMFEDGLDYAFYQAYRQQIDEANEEEDGYRFRIYTEGKFSDATNPWRSVDWLPQVEVVNGSFLSTPDLGLLYAEEWAVDGNFWAYAYELAREAWLFVLGNGYYYSGANGTWYWNFPGTSWFYEYDDSGSGGPGGVTGGSGNWLYIGVGSDALPRIEALDEILIEEMINQNLPGLAVGVFRNGELIHVAGYGVTDIEDGYPSVTPSTMFRWASISKPLTAVATLQLDEAANSFSIGDLVTEHVPYWTNEPTSDEAKITITHLLSNRSGIHHYGNGLDGDDEDTDPDNTYSWFSSRYDTPDPDGYDAEKAVSVFAGTGLDFVPGDDYLYSTFGFNLLGSAVEEASPSGYVDWVKDNIIQPLSIGSLKVAKTSRTGYRKRKDGVLTPLSIGSQEWKLPGGGWESNIVDLTKFAMAVEEGTLLDNPTRLWTSIANNSGYAYGVNRDDYGSTIGSRISHGGAHDNLRTLMSVYPDLNFGVAIMTFAEYANTFRIQALIDLEIMGIPWTTDRSPLDSCNSVMGNGTGRFAGIWRKTGNDVIIRRGYSHDAFLKEWQWLRSNGYYCDNFEPHVIEGKVQWDGIFRKGTGANAMWRGFTASGFEQKVQEMEAIGQRLVDVETYFLGGEYRWAGLFRPGSGPEEFVHGLTTSAFAARREELATQGLKLIDIEVYVVDSELQWAGVFVQGQDGLLNRNQTTAQFGELFQTRSGSGWRLIDIEAYRVNGELLWAGIWEQSALGGALYRDWNYCDIMDKHTDLSADGYELLDLEYFDY